MPLDAHAKAQAQLARARNGAANRPPRGRRWTAQRKIDLLNDIAAGELTRQGALAKYGVTEAELDAWERRWTAHGTRGLMTTKIQELRT
jgi:hypothetical protein